MKRVKDILGTISAMVLVPAMAFAGSTAPATGLESQTDPTVPTVSTAPAVNDSANKSSSGNNTAAALNFLVGGSEVVGGGIMIKSGTASQNYSEVAMGVMMVAMGMQNIAQGHDHQDTATSADVTAGSTDGGNPYAPPKIDTPPGTTPLDPTVDAALKDPNVVQVPKVLATLTQKGIFNPKTGAFTIDGKTYPASTFASENSMAAAGFPSGMIKGAMAANAQAEQKAEAKLDKMKLPSTVAANGYEEGGGSGGGSVVVTDSADSSGLVGLGRNGANGLNKNQGRDPSSLAGMSKNYNGEPIGVAADSIFLMMSRRYKVKESQESFFSPADLALQK